MKDFNSRADIDFSRLKKKWKILYIVALLLAIIFLLFFSLSFSLIIIVLTFIYVQGEKQIIINNSNKLKIKKQQEFINFISYIVVFLENKFNVYQSINICLQYIDICLKEDVELFIKEIDNDKSVIPYMNIASRIGNSQINQIMMMLYQIDKNGYDAKYLSKFPYALDRVNEINIKEKIQRKRNELGIFSIIPILSLLIIVFYMVFSIIGMVGGTIV